MTHSAAPYGRGRVSLILFGVKARWVSKYEVTHDHIRLCGYIQCVCVCVIKTKGLKRSLEFEKEFERSTLFFIRTFSRGILSFQFTTHLVQQLTFL